MSLCECGCGKITNIAKQTENRRGILKGQHFRFVHGHHPGWNGGRTIRGGYVLIYMPEHPFSTAQGYIGESRLVAEKAFGKHIPTKHPIHHSNGATSDNIPKNLVVCEDNAYHKLLHVRINALAACENAKWLKCPFCGKHDDPKNMYVYPHGKYGRHRSCRNKRLKEMRRQNVSKTI